MGSMRNGIVELLACEWLGVWRAAVQHHALFESVAGIGYEVRFDVEQIARIEGAGITREAAVIGLRGRGKQRDQCSNERWRAHEGDTRDRRGRMPLMGTFLINRGASG